MALMDEYGRAGGLLGAQPQTLSTNQQLLGNQIDMSRFYQQPNRTYGSILPISRPDTTELDYAGAIKGRFDPAAGILGDAMRGSDTLEDALRGGLLSGEVSPGQVAEAFFDTGFGMQGLGVKAAGSLGSGALFQSRKTADDVAEDLPDATDGFFSFDEAQQYAESAIPLLQGEETIPDFGARVNLNQTSGFLDQRFAQRTGSPKTDYTPENVESVAQQMALEGQAAAAKAGNATTWYRDKVSNAMKVASLMFPELAQNDVASTQFKFILAVLSNGATVNENTRSAIKTYDQFKQINAGKNTSMMPVSMLEGGGKEVNAMRHAFNLYNEMSSRIGPEELHRFFNTEFTVRELKQAGFNVSGENQDTLVYGSSIFGPKIGQGFFQNLQGNYKPLTSDRWWMRTWGRLTGKLQDPVEVGSKTWNDQSEKLLTQLKNAPRSALRGYKLTELRKDPEKLTALASDILKEYSRSGFKDRSPLNKAAQRLAEGQKRLREQPKGGGERNYMRETVARAQQILADKGIELDIADIQALLWYPEKELVTKLGVGNKRSAPTDYETEFINEAIARGYTREQVDSAIQAGQNRSSGSGDAGSVGGILEEPGSFGYRYPSPVGTERRQNLLGILGQSLQQADNSGGLLQ